MRVGLALWYRRTIYLLIPHNYLLRIWSSIWHLVILMLNEKFGGTILSPAGN